MTQAQRLIAVATKFIGVREVGGENKGPEIEMFQKAIDGFANGQAWCMDFALYCIKQVGPSDLFECSYCLTVWNKSPKELRMSKPLPGSLMIWQKKNSSQGHVGIVIDVIDDGRRAVTVEGNTGPMSVVSREGDGVYKKFRPVHPSIGNLEVVGFLKPWLKPD